MQNVLTLLRAHAKGHLRALRKAINHQEMFYFPPTTVGAFYLSYSNQIGNILFLIKTRFMIISL
jgi:hypothetical protein